MSNSTVTVMIVLESAGLLISIGFLGAAIYLGRKARKELKAAKTLSVNVKDELATFVQRLHNLV